MWRFINSITRAFRQNVHSPRPSVGICAEEEKADHDLADLETDNYQGASCINCSRQTTTQSSFLKKSDNGWLVVPSSITGRDDRGDGWKFCNNDFWKMFQGHHSLLEAISLGSYMLWGSDRDCPKRRACLLYQVLFAVHGGRKQMLPFNGEHQRLSAQSSPIKQEELQKSGATDLKGPAVGVSDASVTETKAETLDSAVQEFQHLCDAYSARRLSRLGLEAMDNGDMSIAVEHLKSACMLGNSSACFNLGLCYETGRGMPQDSVKAEYYYKKAAECGHQSALYNLGLMYLNSDEISEEPCSKPRGLSLLEKAAKLGLAQAQTYLGIHHMEIHNVSTAAQYFQAAAKQNDSEAQYFLAMCYEQGWGVEVNECRAAQLYSVAANAGHDMALYNLGVFNELGLGGIPEDMSTAKDLYKKAAAIGNVQANLRLGEIQTDETVRAWKEKLSYFKTLYQRHHKDGLASYRQNDDGGTSAGCISPSASSPNLIHTGLNYFFGHNDLSHNKNWVDNTNKSSFDPGGESSYKVEFFLGRPYDSIEENTNTSESFVSDCNVSPQAKEIGVTPLKRLRSNTTPDLLFVACTS